MHLLLSAMMFTPPKILSVVHGDSYLNLFIYSYVFNLDMPRNIEEYVHRVGRTGRAGRSGIAVTLVCRRDWAMAAPLIEILVEANQVLRLLLVRFINSLLLNTFFVSNYQIVL